MKKLRNIIIGCVMALTVTGCSCSKVTKVSELPSSQNVLSGSKLKNNITTQQVYEYLRENDADNVNKYFVTRLIELTLDLENNPSKLARFNSKVKEYFKENYVDNDDYKVKGVFQEELVAKQLETEFYLINRQDTPTSGPTFELGLHYDYSDFIERKLNYELGLEILKEDYLLKNRTALLNNSRTRIISIYKNDDLDEMEEVVNKIYTGGYTSLEGIDADKKADEIKEIGRQYCENLGFENEYYKDDNGNIITDCHASTSSSTYDNALKKFTTCENDSRCAPSDGLAYQVSKIEETYRIEEQVINKYTTDILYEGALEQLLRADVGDYLSGNLIPNTDPFLINALYLPNKDTPVAATDIILSSGPGTTLYLVTVRIVDSNSTSDADKEKAMALLLEKVSTTSVLISYFEDLDVEIDDPVLNEYYSQLMGK